MPEASELPDGPPICCRCGEDFPLQDDLPWQMGRMRHLTRLSPKLRRRNGLEQWVDSELRGRGCLCGNCYFDLTDDED